MPAEVADHVAAVALFGKPASQFRSMIDQAADFSATRIAETPSPTPAPVASHKPGPPPGPAA
jgi:hypothetical protein